MKRIRKPILRGTLNAKYVTELRTSVKVTTRCVVLKVCIVL